MIHYSIYTLIFVMILYNLLIIHLFGVPKSISDTFYLLNRGVNKHGGYFRLLMLVLTGVMWLMAIVTEHDSSWLFALSGAGAAFVGVATEFKDKVTNTAHFFGAGVLIGCAVLGELFVFKQAWPLIIMAATLPVLLTRLPNKVYWYEILAFIVIITGILLTF